MALKQALQELVDELEFDTPEEKADFEKYLAKEKLGAAIEARVMKNKDYTTKTQQIAEARKQLDKERATWEEEQDSYLSTLSGYKTDIEGRLDKALKAVSDSNLRGAALEAKIRKLAAEYGVDADELLADVKEAKAVEKKDDTPSFDEETFGKKFVGREEYQDAASRLFNFAPMLRDLEREYSRLYGKEYDGSLHQLVQQAVQDVNKARARGQNLDIYEHMRTKLDFDGQKTRNAEKAKADSEAERKTWEETTRKELEKQVRSEILASNPAAGYKPDDSNAWRQNLTAKGRQDNNLERPRTAQETFKRQQGIHKVYEDQAAKTNAA